MHNIKCENGAVFNVDTEVFCNGQYICVPCGRKQHFQKGEIFPRCFDCIDDNGNPEKLRKGLGLWELLRLSQKTWINDREDELKAIWRGNIIAESDNSLQIEGNWYFPPESVDKNYLKKSKLIYPCYWKGMARYYHLSIDSELDKNAAWYYPKPTRLSKRIMGRDFSNYIAFDHRVKITN